MSGYNDGEVYYQSQVTQNVRINVAGIDENEMTCQSEVWKSPFPPATSDQFRGISKGEVVFEQTPGQEGGQQQAFVQSNLGGIPVENGLTPRGQRLQLLARTRIMGIAQENMSYDNIGGHDGVVVMHGMKTTLHTGHTKMCTGEIVYAKLPDADAALKGQNKYPFRTEPLTPELLRDEIILDENLDVIMQTEAYYEHLNFLIRMIVGILAEGIRKNADADTGLVIANKLMADMSVANPVAVDMNAGLTALLNGVIVDEMIIPDVKKQLQPLFDNYGPDPMDSTGMIDIIQKHVECNDKVKDALVGSQLPVSALFISAIASRILGVTTTAVDGGPSGPDTLLRFDLMVCNPVRNAVHMARRVTWK